MAERTEVMRVPNAIRYSDGAILVKGVRFSYPHALTPQKGQPDKVTGVVGADSFSIVGLMPKATHREAMQLIKKEIDAILLEKKATVKADFKFLRDGNASGKDDYLNHYTISCREKPTKPPIVRDTNGRDKLKVSDDGVKIYGGCWGNILLRPWWQSNGFGKRVNANFLACQIVPANGRDASPLGETSRISEEDVNSMMEDESGAADWEGGETDVDTQGL